MAWSPGVAVPVTAAAWTACSPMPGWRFWKRRRRIMWPRCAPGWSMWSAPKSSPRSGTRSVRCWTASRTERGDRAVGRLVALVGPPARRPARARASARSSARGARCESNHREIWPTVGRTFRNVWETEAMVRTRVHLVRHGEVYNPDRVLYGRMSGFGLSERGRAMATRVAETLSGRGGDITYLAASPLQRAQETARPIADAFGLEVDTDGRLIEAVNHFEGSTIGKNPAVLLDPRHWPRLV